MTTKKTLFKTAFKKDLDFIFKSIFLIIIINILCNYFLMNVVYSNLLKNIPSFLELNIAKILYFVLLFMSSISIKFIIYGVKSKNMNKNIDSTLGVYFFNLVDNFVGTFLTLGFAIGLSLLSGIFFVIPFFYYFQRFIFSVFYVACKEPVEHSDFKHYFCTNTLEKIDSITFNKKTRLTIMNNFFLLISIVLFFVIPDHIKVSGINIAHILKFATIDIFIIHIISCGMILDDADEKIVKRYKNAEKTTQINITMAKNKYNQKTKDKAKTTFFDPQIKYKKTKLK